MDRGNTTLPPSRSPRGKMRRRRSARIVRWVKVRIIAVGSALTLLFGAMAFKAYGLQVENADKYREQARRQHLRMIEIPAPRGAILDTMGRELAVTADADSVYVDPRDIEDVTGTAEVLAEILDLDIRAVEAKLVMRRHFTWIERHVTQEEADELRRARLPGVYITQEPRRFYPGRQLAGPLLGFAGIDGNGLDGLELSMDDLLSGKRSRFAALRDASGRLMMADGAVTPRPGATITLTIDRSIQHIAERAIAHAVTDNDARAGALVVMDVHNGEVLAMASWPGYDSNSPGRAVATKARNRAITDAFEIGSVMKIFTVTAALEAGVIAVDDVIDVEKVRVGRKLLQDDDKQLSIGDIIKRSSNVGAAKIALRLGKSAMYKALRSYGFGEESGIELPGERTGLLRDPRQWGDVALATMSFGYGLTVTPLQVCAALSAVGNDGVYHEPRVIREATGAAGEVLYRRQPVGRRIMTAETAHALLPMLRSVFDKGKFHGTAWYLDSPSFDVGGKTGTARKVDPETRQYSTELYVSSFAGLAPIDDPRIAVVVLVDEPRGKHYYGGRVAGPAFVEVADQTLRYLGVPPKPESSESRAPRARRGDSDDGLHEDDAPDLSGADEGDSVMPMGRGELSGDMVMIPAFTGMSVMRAIDVARAAGIDVEIEGSGRAVEQFPAPGPQPRPAGCRIAFSRTPTPVKAGH